MAGLYPPATLDLVRAANDIVDVIGGVLPLKRAGANFVALCPFHKEKTPSFNVNPQRQIFHCFGCHKGGDVFRFVQDYENISFPEAVRRLADRAKIPLETSPQGGDALNRSVKDDLLRLHEQIAQRWQEALLKNPAAESARQYLRQRGVSAEAVSLFRLGYAPEAWDDTVSWSKSKHYELDLVERGGLIIRKEGAGEARFYDRFRGRLMFPICDEQGRVVAFSGRVLVPDAKAAKYVNSPETPIFTKGKIFYGLDKSKRALLDAQFALVCEGQLDLIACFMSGVQNVVAPQGTAFTPDHARLLKRYVDEVVLCFDSDTAGQAAAVRVLDSLLTSGLTIRVACIPAPHDPDSFIKQHGGAAFRELVQGAPGFFDFYLDHLCSTHGVTSDKGPVRIAAAMCEALQKTGSSVLLDRYAQKTAMRLGVMPETIRAEFMKRSGPSTSSSELPRAAASDTSLEIRPNAQEFWLLKLLLLHDEAAEWLAPHLNLGWLQHPAVRQIVSKRLAAQAAGTWSGAAALLGELDASVGALASEILAENRTVPNPQQQLYDVVLRLRNQSIDREMTRLQASAPSLPESQHAEMLGRLQELRAAKTRPLQPQSEGAAE